MCTGLKTQLANLQIESKNIKPTAKLIILAQYLMEPCKWRIKWMTWPTVRSTTSKHGTDKQLLVIKGYSQTSKWLCHIGLNAIYTIGHFWELKINMKMMSFIIDMQNKLIEVCEMLMQSREREIDRWINRFDLINGHW